MSATCGSSLTEQILDMTPASFSAIVKERLLLLVFVEPADKSELRVQLNKKYSYIMTLPLISKLSIALTTVITCVHSGYMTEIMRTNDTR